MISAVAIKQGKVMAQGRTPTAHKDELTNSFSKIINQINVAVIVQSFGCRRIYVDGSVRTPGSFHIVNRLIVLEAIMVAGGDRHAKR
jgi:protein involved in polysaccharide export with SLBB domain